MSFDKLLMYWDTLDVGALGAAAIVPADGLVIDHNNVLGRGIGGGLWLEVTCQETFIGPSVAILFKHQISAVVALTSPIEIGRKQMVKILPAAGDLLWQVPLSHVNLQFSGVTASWTTNASEGKLSAYLTTAPQAGFHGSKAEVL